jgi:hypothetical protein
MFVISEFYGMVDILEGGKAKEPDDEGNASKQIGPVKREVRKGKSRICSPRATSGHHRPAASGGLALKDERSFGVRRGASSGETGRLSAG